MPLNIELPDHWGDARSVIASLAEAGHRFTEYRVLGRAVVELEMPVRECGRASRGVPGQPRPVTQRAS